MTAKRTPWTPAENAALVRLYFAMLDHAIAGEQYNKAAMIRTAQLGHLAPRQAPGATGPLANRSRGSIEAKLMNATAVHSHLGARRAETMHDHGYRALPNYQAALKDAMRAEIERRDIDRLDRQWMRL